MSPSSIIDAFWIQAIERGSCAAMLPTDDSGTVPYTWAQLAGAVGDVAGQLTQRGIAKGEVVASWMPNSLGWIVLDLACQSIGVCHAAIDSREPPEAATQLARTVSARCLFRAGVGGSESLTMQVDDLCGNTHKLKICVDMPLTAQEARKRASQSVAPASSQPVQILFTSGSTGERKAVQLSTSNLLSNALAKLDAAPQNANDVRLNILPFSHAYARTCELSSWLLTGGQLVIASDWSEFLRFAARVRPTLVNCVPFLAQRIATELERQADALGGRLRLLQCGGAALPRQLFLRLSRLGLPPICGYGMTETSPVVCSARAGLQQPGTVGFPVHGVEVRVDSLSQLYVRGSGVMLGYKNDNHAATIDADGWLATGDLASIRSDGHVVIHGRKSHQIVLSTGYKVDPALIESRLMLSGQIRHCLVTGDGESYITAMVAFEDPACSGSTTLFVRNAAELTRCLPELFADLPRHAVPAKIEPFPVEVTGNADLLTAKGTLRRSRVIAAIDSHKP